MWNRLKYTNFACELFNKYEEGEFHLREDHKHVYIVVDDSFVRISRDDVVPLIVSLDSVVRK